MIINSQAPKRARPFERTQKPTPIWLKHWLGRPLAPTGEEYRKACDGLWQGDSAMDELVSWMREYGMVAARQMYQQALRDGISSVPDCPAALKNFFKTLSQRPEWIDTEAIQDGVRFIHGAGDTAPLVLRDLALMGGYLLSGFNQSLVKTGALEKGTSKRVAETGQWWMHCTDPSVDQPNSLAFQTTLHVRLVHAIVRQHLAAQKDWDSAQWGMPLSQTDMVATYLAFSVAMLSGLRKLGIFVTPRESRGVMHLWAYVCWLMGVDSDRLAQTEAEGIVQLHHAVLTQSPPDSTSQILGKALSEEPLSRQFGYFPKLRQQFAYQSHLSTTRYFLPPRQMQQLGLPNNIKPWYPVLTMPGRMFSYSVARAVPLLRPTLIRRGRAAQVAALQTIFRG